MRFGSDTTSHCVWIGELSSTWSFPQVSVDNFKCGFSATPSDYAEGWDISFETAFDTIQDTVTTSLPVAQYSQDSAKLNGQAPSYYATASDYLPLTGGTLTGNLSFTGSRSIGSSFFDLDYYSNGTVPINSGRLELKTGGKTGWDVGDELGAIEWYVGDGSGVGARTAARIVAVNNQGNGTSTTTFEGDLEFYTSPYNGAINSFARSSTRRR